jgi:hypothetical protein
VRLLESLGVLQGGNVLPAALQSALAVPRESLSSAVYARVDAAGLEASVKPCVELPLQLDC